MDFTLNDAVKPVRMTKEAAGYDLFARAEVTVIGGQGTVVVPTGVTMKLHQPNSYAKIEMRSGLAIREHLAVSAGVIDRDYTGEIGVLVFCTKIGHQYTIKKGERFAQLVPILLAHDEGVAIGSSTRKGGFGSTGITEVSVELYDPLCTGGDW